MAQEKNISRAIIGMDESHSMNMKEGSYAYALNADIENFDGNGLPILTNTGSNILCTGFPENFSALGFVNILEQSRIIWFLTDQNGHSQLGETTTSGCKETIQDGLNFNSCDDCGTVNMFEQLELENITPKSCCNYQMLADDDCLNFDKDFPITAVEYQITDCGIRIVFADGLNGRRYLEFEYVDGDSSNSLIIKKEFYVIEDYETPPCEVPIYGTDLDCNKLKIQPNLVTPCIEFLELVPGGSNRAGSYQFFIAYSDESGNKLSSFTGSTNIIPIFTKAITFETDYVTDKAIKLSILNIDDSGPYQYYTLAVAKTINNNTSFYIAGNYPVTKKTVTYTGNDDAEIKLTALDIFQRFPYYNNAGTVTSSNNILYWGDLTEFPKMNLQRVANNIKLMWQTIAIPEQVYSDPKNVNKFRSGMRDEVYPRGIVFILDNGAETSAYHIPGREATGEDLETVNNNDVFNDESCLNEEFVPCDDQVEVSEEDLNTESPIPDVPEYTLNTENIAQASSCIYIPYSDSPTPVIGGDPVITVTTPLTIPDTFPFLLRAKIQNGSPVSYKWKQLSGPIKVTLQEIPFDATNETLDAYVTDFVSGNYTFEVYGEKQFLIMPSSSSSAVVTVNVTAPPNQAPIADAGADKVVYLPNNSFLNGGNSLDEDGDISTYEWSQTSGPGGAVITYPNRPYTSVTGLSVGTFVFKLKVTDNTGCFSEVSTTIYVEPDPATQIPDCVNHLFPINGEVVGYASVTLNWADAPGATSYDVYLSTGLIPGPFTLEITVPNSNVVLSDLDPNTIYNWYVVPKNINGNPTGCEAYYRTFITVCEQPGTSNSNARWRIYNTASITGGDLEIYDGCNESCYQYGEFAYWQSSEKYPNIPEVWGDLCGQPIRHHKNPDSIVSHIHDREDAESDFTKSNLVFPLGVKVDHDSVRNSLTQAVTAGIITQADRDRIVGYRIVTGNRFNNKSVIAKGLLFDVNQYRRKKGSEYIDPKPVYFSNFPFNDLRSNQFITDDLANYDTHNKQRGADLPFVFSNRYTLHSPDTSFTEPSGGVELKLETIEYGKAETQFVKSNKLARQKFLSDTAYALAFTGGIVAALLSTEEKEIKEYTVKGNVISGLGVASGTWGPHLPTIGGGKADDLLINPNRAGIIVPATEVTSRTVQGKRKDYYNPIFLAKRKPALLPFWPFMVANNVANFLTIVIQEANIILDLIKSMTPYRDWSIQSNAVGKYNAFTTVPNSGFKRRKLLSKSYLKGENTLINERNEFNINEYDSLKFNNYHRESALYLKYLGKAFNKPDTYAPVADTSRYTLEDAGCNLNSPTQSDVVSYYASVKNYVPDQYGSIYDIEYLNTGSCAFPMDQSNDDCKGVYGGDTFIDRFALKRKTRFFSSDTFGLEDGVDFDYSLYSNIAYARHYYNNTLGVGSEFDNILDIFSLLTPGGMATFLGRPKSIRDCSTNKFFYQNGYIYNYSYGIPYFFVESDINLAYRYGENLREKGFYPAQSDLNFWLQEENVPIKEDNSYQYNNVYSKQNKETPIVIDGPSFEPGRDCEDTIHPNRIIYTSNKNWLTYKANDFYDFPISKGRIVSVDALENNGVFVRTTNASFVFKSVIRTMVDGQTVQIGNGSVFSNPPEEYPEGSQHRAMVNTEYGHVFVNAKAGKVLNLGLAGQGMEEISKDGKRNWFKENLPFRLKKDFPKLSDRDIDNNFAGVGITMSYDKRFARVFITKLDYAVKDKNIIYNTESKKFFLNDQEVKLTSKRYFKKKSWTIGYSFYTKSWISYYSFKPNYYIDDESYFGSGQEDGFWLHNLTKSSNQVFYGKLNPFIFEPVLKFDAELKQFKALEFDTEVRRYTNEFDYKTKKDVAGVNKLVVYNDVYNSGLLNLVKVDKNNLDEIGKYPVRNFDSWDVELSIYKFKWRVNQIYDLTRDNSELPLWAFDGNNADKTLNEIAFNYQKDDFELTRMRGQWFKTRMINDALSNYKIVHKFNINSENATIS